jgi:hypothetical protein
MICEHKPKAEILRFFANAEQKTTKPEQPKWAFHIEQICGYCGKHLGFLKQDKELIERLDGRLLMENFIQGREKTIQGLK